MKEIEVAFLMYLKAENLNDFKTDDMVSSEVL